MEFVCLRKDKGSIVLVVLQWPCTKEAGGPERTTIASLMKDRWGDTTKASTHSVEK